jgi:hypothetical protein
MVLVAAALVVRFLFRRWFLVFRVWFELFH